MDASTQTLRPDTRKYRVTHLRTVPLRLAPHPGTPDVHDWRKWVEDSTEPVAVDLFCGAGGLSHGLDAAGYRVVLAADTDEWALESHRHNIAGSAMRFDLADPQARDEIATMLDGVDVGLVAGGPPCQPFSRAGRYKIRSLVRQGLRSAEDGRRELWRVFLELVERIRPRAVLMENVPDMALGDGFTAVRVMIQRLGEAGYNTDARIVDAWRHGVPQHRQRLILVGLSGENTFEWPAEEAQVTVRDAIWDLPRLNVAPDTELGAPMMDYITAAAHHGEVIQQNGKNREDDVHSGNGHDGNGSRAASVQAGAGDSHGALPVSSFAVRAREGCTGDSAGVVHDHMTRPVRVDDLEAFKLMDGQTLYSDLPDVLKRYRDDTFQDKYNRLDWDEPSRTITAHLAKDGYWYIHPEQHRTLTVREAARIQTFPDSFRFAGCRTHQFEQIGNAVPPVLAQQIGSAVLRSLNRQPSQRGDPRQQRGSQAVQRREFRGSMLRWADHDSDARRSISALAAGGGSRQRWADMLAGPENGLVDSNPALRVATRVSGFESIGRPVLRSTARMELAKLVGIGQESRTLNAAAHVLGTALCKPRNPLCGQCPVYDVCAWAADSPALQPAEAGV